LVTAVAYSFKPPATEATDVPARASLADCVRVFEGEFDYVLRTLQRLGASRADAEDLTQEVFLVMWRRRADWNPLAPLRPWLAAIAYRVALAHRRRSLREVPAGLLDAEDQGRAAEDHLVSASARKLVLETLSALPPKQRAVLVMHELDGQTMKDIARSLKLPLFTAYSRLRVARQRFAKELRRKQQQAGFRMRRATTTQALLFGPAEALLAAERPIPAAPASVKRRVLERVSRLAPEAPLPGFDAPIGAGGHLPAALAGLALLVSVVGFALLSRGPSIVNAAGTDSGDSPARTVASVLPAPSEVGARPRLRPATLVTPAPGASAAAERLAGGVVGYWRFDEAKGTATTRDVSGLGVDCVLRRIDSTDWSQGQLGRAIRLTGGGWVECPSSPGLRRITDQITIAAWVQQAKKQPNLRTIVSRQHGTGSDDDFYLGLVLNRVIFSSRVWGRLEVPVKHEVGRWFHLAAVGQADGTIRLYRDGQEIGRGLSERQALSLASTPEDNPVLVGAANNRPDPTIVDQKLNGSVDELLVYDRALDAGEISQLASGIQPRM
jgi:RNA polymerase sigma-70 factor (ECF subfamily)